MASAQDNNNPRRTRRRDEGDDGGAEHEHEQAGEAGNSDGSRAAPARQNKRRRPDQRYRPPSPSAFAEIHSFPPGAILRVTLKNFVTYSAAEFFPGPNMNLVIGPNGSGKSTIVCAICLGLGYKPDVLGRAAQISEFVQHGKDAAEIEIELAQADGASVVVKRKLKRDKNQSQYWINGSPATSAFELRGRETVNACKGPGAHGRIQHSVR